MGASATVDPCVALLSKAVPRVGITAWLVEGRRSIPADNLLGSPGKSSVALHMVQESGFDAGACSIGENIQ
jgi:hypothetical protein